MRGLIAWTVVAITVLSLWWTTRQTRALLRRALGRELHEGEEMSLRSWMQASDGSLENATRDLERDPFDRCLQFLASLGLRWPVGSRPEEPGMLEENPHRLVTPSQRKAMSDISCDRGSGAA